MMAPVAERPRITLDRLSAEIQRIYEDAVDPVAARFVFERRPPIGEIQGPPTVLLLGNHSSGKSTFINHLLGQEIQRTGLAPTDDSFTILTHAPGDGNPIGGLKVMTRNGWFAARPSGTEDVYKLYAESFLSAEHLQRVQAEAQALVAAVLAA